MHMVETCGFPATVKYVTMLCYVMLSYVYIDFCQKSSVKMTKYRVFACSDHMHVLYVEITRIPLQIDFKIVSIVECFRGGRV